MSARTDRRWAELAQELEFDQLPQLRRQAEGWRAGLTGLTALLTVLATLKGRDNLADLPDGARLAATALVGAAFLLLLAGALLSNRAANGKPGEEIWLAGQALRRWTEQEVRRAGRGLRIAAYCCAGGLLLAAAGLGVAWTATETPAAGLVMVRTPAATVCGELVSAGPHGVVIWAATGSGKELRTIPEGTVTPVAACK